MIWPSPVPEGTGGTVLVLGVAGCYGNLGGTVTPVVARVDVVSAAEVGTVVDGASTPSVESGTTSFGTGIPG